MISHLIMFILFLVLDANTEINSVKVVFVFQTLRGLPTFPVCSWQDIWNLVGFFVTLVFKLPEMVINI